MKRKVNDELEMQNRMILRENECEKRRVKNNNNYRKIYNEKNNSDDEDITKIRAQVHETENT